MSFAVVWTGATQEKLHSKGENYFQYWNYVENTVKVKLIFSTETV